VVDGVWRGDALGRSSRWFPSTVSCSVCPSGQSCRLVLGQGAGAGARDSRAAFSPVVPGLERDLSRRVHVLEGLLPICSFCKNIRNEAGEWERLETFISKRSEARSSRTACARRAGRATTLASRATADAHKWLFQSDTLFQQRAGDVPAHFAIVLLDAIG
jgi:hypothetical protein